MAMMGVELVQGGRSRRFYPEIYRSAGSAGLAASKSWDQAANDAIAIVAARRGRV